MEKGKNRSRLIIMLILTALAFALSILGGCDKGVKQVRIRYKYVPGMELDYRLKLAGPSKEYSDDSLIENLYVEATEDFSWLVRRVLEDSTAELRFTGNWISDRWQVTDSTRSDSAIHHESPAPDSPGFRCELKSGT